MKTQLITRAEIAKLAVVTRKKVKAVSLSKQRNFPPVETLLKHGAKAYNKDAVLDWLSKNDLKAMRLSDIEWGKRSPRKNEPSRPKIDSSGVAHFTTGRYLTHEYDPGQTVTPRPSASIEIAFLRGDFAPSHKRDAKKDIVALARQRRPKTTRISIGDRAA